MGEVDRQEGKPDDRAHSRTKACTSDDRWQRLTSKQKERDENDTDAEKLLQDLRDRRRHHLLVPLEITAEHRHQAAEKHRR